MKSTIRPGDEYLDNNGDYRVVLDVYGRGRNRTVKWRLKHELYQPRWTKLRRFQLALAEKQP